MFAIAIAIAIAVAVAVAVAVGSARLELLAARIAVLPDRLADSVRPLFYIGYKRV